MFHATKARHQNLHKGSHVTCSRQNSHKHPTSRSPNPRSHPSALLHTLMTCQAFNVANPTHPNTDPSAPPPPASHAVRTTFTRTYGFHVTQSTRHKSLRARYVSRRVSRAQSHRQKSDKRKAPRALPPHAPVDTSALHVGDIPSRRRSADRYSHSQLR